MNTKLTPEETYLASLPLWLVRAELEANGEVDSDFLIAVTEARIKAARVEEERSGERI